MINFVCMIFRSPHESDICLVSFFFLSQPEELLEYTGFDFAKILDIAEKVCSKVQSTPITSSKRELLAVKRKYESSRYQLVANDFDEPHMDDILGAYGEDPYAARMIAPSFF